MQDQSRSVVVFDDFCSRLSVQVEFANAAVFFWIQIEPLQTDMVYSNGSHDDDHHHTSSKKKQQDCQSKNSGSNNNYGVVPPRHHPSLSTWNPPLDHGFSAKQMEALTCLCDALVPSLQASSLHHDLNTDNRHQSSFESLGIGGRNVDDVNAFYKLSASEAGVPPIVSPKNPLCVSDKIISVCVLRDHLFLGLTR
jgi:hypothetical protein